MQEILLVGEGLTEKPQDPTQKVRLVSSQLLYAVVDSDPVRLVSSQLLYAVQEENL